MKEFKNFYEFYKNAEIFAKRIRKMYSENAITSKLVDEFTDIQECFPIGEIPQSIQTELKSNSSVISSVSLSSKIFCNSSNGNGCIISPIGKAGLRKV